VELYLHSPNTPSWRGAQSTGTTLTLPFAPVNSFKPLRGKSLRLLPFNKSIYRHIDVTELKAWRSGGICQQIDPDT